MAGSNALLMGKSGCSDYIIINSAFDQQIVGPIGDRYIYTLRGYGESIIWAGGTTNLGNINYTQIKFSNLFAANVQQFYTSAGTYNGGNIGATTVLSVAGNKTATSWSHVVVTKGGVHGNLYRSDAGVIYNANTNLTSFSWADQVVVTAPDIPFVIKFVK